MSVVFKVTPSTTERAVLGPSESDEEEENHLLLFLSVNRGASSSTEQPEVDVRIGEPSTVVFTSTETPSSIGEPSSLVLVSTEPPSSTTTEPTTTTTTTEPSTTTKTTEPSTTTTTTEPATTTTTTEPSTTTTNNGAFNHNHNNNGAFNHNNNRAFNRSHLYCDSSDDKPLGAPKSPDSSGKESVPGGKNPPGSLPDISGLGNSVSLFTTASDDTLIALQGQTRSSSPRPTGNQDSPSALANRIIEMALQRQKAVTSSQLVGSAVSELELSL
uniref:Uncharacterized protein n=1 Tax=Timema poppense TaxID=170557 RepID=A0A7R9H839_TIMPO|nr:unnamed protein product [Timema poppensis]